CECHQKSRRSGAKAEALISKANLRHDFVFRLALLPEGDLKNEIAASAYKKDYEQLNKKEKQVVDQILQVFRDGMEKRFPEMQAAYKKRAGELMDSKLRSADAGSNIVFDATLKSKDDVRLEVAESAGLVSKEQIMADQEDEEPLRSY